MHVTVHEWSTGESTTCCSAACPVVVVAFVVVVGSGKQSCLFVAAEKPICSCCAVQAKRSAATQPANEGLQHTTT